MSSTSTKTMKAVHYENPYKVSVKEVPLPKLEHPDDAIIKVTTAGTISSYLPRILKPDKPPSSNLRVRPAHVSGADGGRKWAHIRSALPHNPPLLRIQKPEWIILSRVRNTGHENMGIIEEVGSGVTLLKKGDRVVLPFNVADGRCRNCEEGKTAFCTGVNPGFAGGAYGYVSMGPYKGGQVTYSCADSVGLLFCCALRVTHIPLSLLRPPPRFPTSNIVRPTLRIQSPTPPRTPHH